MTLFNSDTPRSPEAQPEKRSIAWLIEANCTYWDGRFGFDADPNQAVRFVRQEDAERVRCWLLSHAFIKDHAFALRSTEHVWLDNPRLSAPTLPEPPEEQ